MRVLPAVFLTAALGCVPPQPGAQPAPPTPPRVAGPRAPAGAWNPDRVSTDARELTWDVGEHLRPGEPVEFTFDWQQGWHALAIEWAALEADGKEVARDAHEGWTGSEDKQNTYRFDVPARRASAWTLRARVRSVGGNESTGMVFSSATPPASPRPPGRAGAPSLLDRARHADIGAAHRALGEGKWDDAIRLYREAGVAGKKGSMFEDIEELITKRQSLGDVAPEWVHRVCVVWLTERRIRRRDGRVDAVPDVTEEMKARWQHQEFGVIKRLAELYSGGVFTFEFATADAWGEHEDGDRFTYLAREKVEAGDWYFQEADRCDTFAVGNTTASPGLGGFSRPAFVRGVFNGPERGGIQFNARHHDAGILFHELFHVLENAAPTGVPGHAWEEIDEWKHFTEFGYFRWHFEKTFPKTGWDRLLLRRRRTALPGRDVEALRRVRALYEAIPAAEREKRDGRARELAAEAAALYEKTRNATEPVRLLEQALELSPANPEALGRLVEYTSGWESHAIHRERLKDVQRVHGTFPAPADPAVIPVGVWTPDRLHARGEVTLEWDVTEHVAPGETLEVSFVYDGGRHALQIDRATLWQGGVQTAADEHRGIAGKRLEGTVYLLAVSPGAKAGGARYVVRARVRGLGGVDSTGIVFLRRRPAG